MNIQFLLLIFIFLNIISARLREGQCEVCIKTMTEFAKEIKEQKAKNEKDITNVLKDQCKIYRKGTKERRLCYYIGADDTSASGFLKDLSKWFSFSLPPEKVSFFFFFFFFFFSFF